MEHCVGQLGAGERGREESIALTSTLVVALAWHTEAAAVRGSSFTAALTLHVS